MEPIEGVVRHYHWGDTTFIPRLLGIPPDGTPYAELWFGAHPSAPSRLAETGLPLDDAVSADPVGLTGHPPDPSRPPFPFLAKVLAAAGPLSIQVHPDAAQAREGFAAENAAGIALDAADRTYRDPYPKPELICAVTPFTAKCGLRPVEETLRLLSVLDAASDTAGALDRLRATLAAPEPPTSSLATVVRQLFELSSADVTALVDVVVAAAANVDPHGPFADEMVWTGRLAEAYPGDIGVVVALLLNHVELQPGQALYLGAGNLHSYLGGAAVEVMAPSDNVVRGGLTSKHIDTDELLALVDPTPIRPPVQVPDGPVHRYEVAGDAFGLVRLDLDAAPDQTLRALALLGPAVLIATGGHATLHGPDRTLRIGQGQAAFVRANDGPVRVDGGGTVHWADAGR